MFKFLTALLLFLGSCLMFYATYKIGYTIGTLVVSLPLAAETVNIISFLGRK